MLELYNLNYSKDIARYANSTYDLAATFKKVALNREASSYIRTILEARLSRATSASYTAKDYFINKFSLIDKLIYNNLAKR